MSQRLHRRRSQRDHGGSLVRESSAQEKENSRDNTILTLTPSLSLNRLSHHRQARPQVKTCQSKSRRPKRRTIRGLTLRSKVRSRRNRALKRLVEVLVRTLRVAAQVLRQKAKMRSRASLVIRVVYRSRSKRQRRSSRTSVSELEVAIVKTSKTS